MTPVRISIAVCFAICFTAPFLAAWVYAKPAPCVAGVQLEHWKGDDGERGVTATITRCPR